MFSRAGWQTTSWGGMRTPWIFALLLPELLALSQRPGAPVVSPGALHCTSPARLALRGGGDGSGPEVVKAASAAATTAADLQKTADLLARVSLEQNEAEELMKEKRAADASCAELEQAQEQAKAELATSAWALLRAAAKSGDAPSVKEALEKGADAKIVDEDGMNALHHAAAGGHADAMELLLAHDPSMLSAQAADGSSALHLAAYYGFRQAAEILIASGADVHAGDAEGSTALHNAAYRGNSEIVSLLVKAGSPVNLAQTKDRLTALHLACMSGDSVTVSVLLEASADATCLSVDGKSAADIARQCKHANVQVLLSGVGLEDLEKAELAAKFVAARLLDKVRCNKQQNDLTQHQQRTKPGHAPTKPSVVSWAPPQVKISSGWEVETIETKKSASPVASPLKRCKPATDENDSPRKSKGKKRSKSKRKEKHAKRSAAKSTTTLWSLLLGTRGDEGAAVQSRVKKVWAEGQVPTPYHIRSVSDWSDYMDAVRAYLSRHPDANRSVSLVLSGVGLLCCVAFGYLLESVDSEWADRHIWSRLPSWVLKYGGWQVVPARTSPNCDE